MPGPVIFLQNHSHKAGAQTCLLRLLRHPGMRAWKPILVCGKPGWLVEECRRLGLPVVLPPFPSSRSLPARLFLNARFARAVKAALPPHPGTLPIVHANDHWEGLLGLRLAGALGSRSAIFLRSSGMTRTDYVKYGCPSYHLVGAVGDELRQRAQRWDPERRIELIHDGIEAGEICPPKPKPKLFPRRILVIGSPHAWKGWATLTMALQALQGQRGISELQFDFTGERPDRQTNDLQVDGFRAGTLSFLGRQERFRELIQRYDLAINTSWSESFGMAAIEVLAAGVPLLSSRTGIIEQVIEQPEFLFRPRQADELAAALSRLHREWGKLPTGVARAQENIRNRFLIDHTVARLTSEYERLLKQPP